MLDHRPRRRQIRIEVQAKLGRIAHRLTVWQPERDRRLVLQRPHGPRFGIVPSLDEREQISVVAKVYPPVEIEKRKAVAVDRRGRARPYDPTVRNNGDCRPHKEQRARHPHPASGADHALSFAMKTAHPPNPTIADTARKTAAPSGLVKKDSIASWRDSSVACRRNHAPSAVASRQGI